MKTKYEDEVRDRVRQAYAKAVTSTMSVEASSCACSPRSERKGSVSKFAGYDTKELAQMPEEAVVSSFGCGNPVAFSQIGAGQTVVDLGSGAGLDLFLAAQKVGPTGHVIGIDMTPEMIERARANIAAAGIRNVEVRQGIIEDMPVESGTVDWVISNCVINLSPQKGKVFSEIHRVLRPGGRLVIGFIDRESALGQHYLAHQAESVFYREATFLSADEVEDLLLEAGFTISAWGQTLAHPLPETVEIEPLRPGRGQCAFVVVAAETIGRHAPPPA